MPEVSEGEQQRILEALHEMFQTQGWKELEALQAEKLEALNDIAQIKDGTELAFRQGKRQVLAELKLLPSVVRESLDAF